jgi:hypothetical protein
VTTGRDVAKLAHQLRQLALRVEQLQKRVNLLTAAHVLTDSRMQRVVQSIGPLAIGSTDVAVPWPTPWAVDTYVVIPELATGALALGTLHATLKLGTRTTTDCVVTVNATAAVGVAFLDVLGIRV